MTTITALSVLTVLAMAVGFTFGRVYEAAQRKSKSRSTVLDLRPNEWEHVA
jgi:hypothetical protein